jgi:peptide-methionine (S)-S-oxide reductase
VSRAGAARPWLGALAALLALAGCAAAPADSGASAAREPAQAADRPAGDSEQTADLGGDMREVALFAGGCFWCMEPPFDDVPGVHATISGYTGGEEVDPTYEQVSSGRTGHAEAVQVIYDPEQVGYRELLEVYWRNTDPTVSDRQFCDHGNQYRPAIFYLNPEQQRLAEESRRAIEEAGTLPGPVVTEITQAGPFYPAEDYHQDFYTKNPVRYRTYRFGCGRDARLRELWGETAGH